MAWLLLYECTHPRITTLNLASAVVIVACALTRSIECALLCTLFLHRYLCRTDVVVVAECDEDGTCLPVSVDDDADVHAVGAPKNALTHALWSVCAASPQSAIPIGRVDGVRLLATPCHGLRTTSLVDPAYGTPSPVLMSTAACGGTLDVMCRIATALRIM